MRLHTLLLKIMLCIPLASAAQPAPPMPLSIARPITFDSQDRHADGTSVVVSGWWLPSQVAGKRATVIALHGCGGLYRTRPHGTTDLTARHAAMTTLLHEAGYHVLLPDSFTTRGKRSICTEKINARDITTAHRRADVLGALTWLAAQADVDPGRIALLGWSHGGSTVLSSIQASRPEVASHAVQPKVAVAFYPGCQASLTSRVPYRHAVPLLILMGEDDDWTPAASCVALEKKSRAQGDSMTLNLYANSYHDFDSPGAALRVRNDIPNGVRPGEGVTTGENTVARAAAYQAMLMFLADQLK